MLLETVGEDKAAADIEKGIKYACTQMKSMSAGKMGMSTTEVGDTVAAHI